MPTERVVTTRAASGLTYHSNNKTAAESELDRTPKEFDPNLKSVFFTLGVIRPFVEDNCSFKTHAESTVFMEETPSESRASPFASAFGRDREILFKSMILVLCKTWGSLIKEVTEDRKAKNTFFTASMISPELKDFEEVNLFFKSILFLANLLCAKKNFGKANVDDTDLIVLRWAAIKERVSEGKGTTWAHPSSVVMTLLGRLTEESCSLNFSANWKNE